MSIKKRYGIIIVIVVLILISIPILIQHNNKLNFEKAKQSVVTVISGIDLQKEILTSDVIVGTGFCYESGKVITNYHNIKENIETISVITYDNLTVPAKVIAKDEENDIALLEIDVDLPALVFSDIDECELGQSVISISTPISPYLRNTYSEGLITNFNIVGFSTQRLIQTDINLSPGCSGSPLLDSKCHVVGMTTFKSTEFGAEGLGFAIPCDRLCKIIDRLENEIDTLDLQITFHNDIYQKFGIPGAPGLVVQEISAESPVKKMLQVGDIITKIDDLPVKNLVEYVEALEQHSHNQDLRITVVRNSKEQNIVIEGDLL